MTVLWAGGEDSDVSFVGGVSVTTTANSFRSSVARCALNVAGPILTPINSVYWHAANVFSASTFWMSARVYVTVGGSQGSSGLHVIRWLDSSGIVRLRIRNTVGGGTGLQTLVVEKVDSAGTATQLGSALSINFSTSPPAGPDKFDISIIDAVAGSITIYINGVQSYTYSGDTTTDGVSTLTGFDLGTIQNGGVSNLFAWSEVIIADTDTRSWSLQTFAPVANGNTHNFNVGSPAAANVNEITLDDSTLDGSTTAGQIDEYTCPAVASGTFAVQAFGVSARMQRGSSGPSKADLLVRTGGADFASADQSLTLAWANYQNWWQTNPNTLAAWATSEIGAAAGFNIGIKSVT